MNVLEYFGGCSDIQKIPPEKCCKYTSAFFFFIDVLEMVATILVVLQNDSPSLNVLVHDIAFH